MPQKYTLEYLKNNKVAVNCRTLEEASKFRLESKMVYGNATFIDAVKYYKDKICFTLFYIEEGSHSDIYFYASEGFKIIPASDFLKDWEDESKVTPIADIRIKGDGGFEFIDHTNATTIAAIRTHLAEIDNLLKTIK